MATRVGDWIQTATGGRYYPLDPRPEETYLADIAHALSLICRFGGHTRRFYSVAQHSVLVSRHVPEWLALAGLLHDAAEAYIGDMVRPLKREPEMAAYRAIEQPIQQCIERTFGLAEDVTEHPAIKAVDRRMCATEARDLMFEAYAEGWAAVEPFPDLIIPEPPELAEDRFLRRFEGLTA